MPDRERIEDWRNDGLLVIPEFLSLKEAASLRQICDSVLSEIRRSSTGLGHTTANIAFLTEPKYFRDDLQPLVDLLEFVGSKRVRAVIHEILPEQDSQQRLLFHNTQYFHEQTVRSWDGDWHRDSQFLYPDAHEEMAFVLNTTALHFRVAFVPDDCLEFVPGSHRRGDTPNEHAVRKGKTANGSSMPNARRIELNPGDACVFHAWGIHRGTYMTNPVRRTLDLIYGLDPCPPGPAVPTPTCFQMLEILNALSPDCRLFFDRFIAAYEPYWSPPGTPSAAR
jgi:ectoine hydroxylase-related dioxygenase (phytanoyl-CoA dioxygenase family)